MGAGSVNSSRHLFRGRDDGLRFGGCDVRNERLHRCVRSDREALENGHRGKVVQVTPTDLQDAVSQLTDEDISKGVFMWLCRLVGVLLGIVFLWCKDKRKLLSLIAVMGWCHGASGQTVESSVYTAGPTASVDIPATAPVGSLVMVFAFKSDGNVMAPDPTLPGTLTEYGTESVLPVRSIFGYAVVQSGQPGTSLGSVTESAHTWVYILSGVITDHLQWGVWRDSSENGDPLVYPNTGWTGTDGGVVVRCGAGDESSGLNLNTSLPNEIAEQHFKAHAGVISAPANSYGPEGDFHEDFGGSISWQVAMGVAAAGQGGNPQDYGDVGVSVGDVIDGQCVTSVQIVECEQHSYGGTLCHDCAGNQTTHSGRFWGQFGIATGVNPCDYGLDRCDCVLGSRIFVAHFDGDDCAACGPPFCDPCEPNGDDDGDTIPNISDDDQDGNGILDAEQSPPPCWTGGPISPCSAAGDADGDGIRNDAETDADNDNVPNGSDCSPYGNGCGGCAVGGCLSTDDFDGDSISNENETDPDIDGDGIPNQDDNTPYGCGPGTVCACHPCDDDGDADGDGIRNDDPAETDDDDDGQLDVDDPCPRGCNCCTTPQQDIECADCENRFLIRKARPNSDPLHVSQNGTECTDYAGNRIDRSWFITVETEAECDWDNDSCENANDIEPCDPAYGCEACRLELNSRMALLRVAILCWLTDDDCVGLLDPKCAPYGDIDGDGDPNVEDIDVDGDSEKNEVDATPWGNTCSPAVIGGYNGYNNWLPASGPPRTGGNWLQIHLPSRWDRNTGTAATIALDIKPGTNPGEVTFWAWAKDMMLAMYTVGVSWVALKMLAGF